MENESQVNQDEGKQGQNSQGSHEGDQRNGIPGWNLSLPVKWQGHEFVKGHEKSGDFVESAWKTKQELDALKAKTEKAIFQPAENASSEEMTAYRKAMGIPEKQEDYKLDRPQLPEGMPYDETIESWFKEEAYRGNIPLTAAQSLYSSYMKKMVESYGAIMKQRKEHNDAALSAVKQSWGNEMNPNHEFALQGQKKLIELAPDASIRETLAKFTPESSPVFYWVLSLIGKAARNTPFAQGQGAGQTKKGGFEYKNTPPI